MVLSKLRMDEPGSISPPAADEANMLLRLIRAKGWDSTKGKLPKKLKKKKCWERFSPFKGSLENSLQMGLVGMPLSEAPEGALCRAVCCKPAGTDVGFNSQLSGLRAVPRSGLAFVPSSQRSLRSDSSVAVTANGLFLSWLCSRRQGSFPSAVQRIYSFNMPPVFIFLLVHECPCPRVHAAVLYERLLWAEVGFTVCKDSRVPHTRISYFTRLEKMR